MRLNVRCPGYKKPPTITYRSPAMVGKLPFYGLGKCSGCGRVVALAPKSGTVVMHKILPQLNDPVR